MQPVEVLTAFERDIMGYLLKGDDPVLEILRNQFQSATIESRKNTGVGIYVNFDVPTGIRGVDQVPGIKSNFCFGDVRAFIGQQEVGFLLWIAEGKLHSLEGYCYGSEPWPDPERGYRLLYFGDKRNLEGIRKNWMK